MKTFLFCLGYLCLSGASLCQATETYLLRAMADEQVGAEYRTVTTLALDDNTFTMTGPKGQMSGEMNSLAEKVHVRRVTKVEGGKAAEYTKHFEKHVEAREMIVGGQKNGQDKPGPLDGMKMVARLEGGKWVKTLEGGGEPANEKQARELKNDDFDQTLYPEKAVAIGDSWEVPTPALKELLGTETEKFEGSLKMKLLRIEPRDGDNCAVMEAELKAAADEQQEGATVKMTFDLKGIVYRSLANLVDVDAKFAGTMKLDTLQGPPGGQVRMQAAGPMTLKERVTVTRP